MLANVVQELIRHVEAQHTQHKGENVDYILVGKFIVGPSFLFKGNILGYTSDNMRGFAHSLTDGKQIIISTQNLGQRLLDKDSAQRGLPQGYYKTEFHEPHIYNPIIIEISSPGEEQHTEELESIGKIFGKPSEVIYNLPDPVFKRLMAQVLSQT